MRLDFVQPFSGTDLAAMVLGMLSLLYAALWVRDRERGMSWLALSFGIAAIWYAASERHLPTGTHIDVGTRGWAMVIQVSTMTMTVGIFLYLGRLTAARRWLLIALLAPGVVQFAWLLAGLALPRVVANAVALLGYLGAAGVAYASARREPGAGHGVIGAALLAVPLCLAVLVWQHAEIRLLRYYGVLPVLFFGLTLLTVSLQRRRRALEAEVRRRAQAEAKLTRLNQTLEQQVLDRTSDLQGMVAGLESFNRSVSHDLRGPLGGIEGLARLALEALERGDTSVARRVLPAIAAQADTSHRLVSALLTLARVGDAALRRAPVVLGALVDEVLGQVALADSQRSLPQVEVASLPTVHADADLLRPVLVNLIGNAIKFSREREAARVQISSSANDAEFVVCVRDNGVGFDAGQSDRLFQPFQRLHGRQFEGTGIGLSIVRRAVERHGGRVWAEAAPGGGAAFYFTLPRAAA
ncbi:MAG: hypothetical protein IV094_00950 [Vitreoscilla sp.]|nr:hypothetical protein [Vitreoscilla sp.]